MTKDSETWYRRDNGIYFKQGNHQKSPKNRAQYHAKLFREWSSIDSFLNKNSALPLRKALDIGCGYGRLTPWINTISEKTFAIDHDSEALGKAKKQYPEIEFRNERIQETSFEDSEFDLLFAWNVLMHIPEVEIKDAINEMKRILSEEGHVLIMENIQEQPESPVTWGRTVEKYESLFKLPLQDEEFGPVAETYQYSKRSKFRASDNKMMLFKNQ